MEYRVELSPQAHTDADEAYMWIAQHSVRNALRWYRRLLKTIDTLKHNPHRCPAAPDAAAFRGDVRQLLFGKRGGVYRILFRIQTDSVEVLRIVHGARRFFNGN